MSSQASYSTAEIAPRDRFAYWREAVCDSYVQLGCEAGEGPGFKGRLEIERHSALSVSRVSGTAHRVVRRPSDIRAASEADFLVSLQTANSSRVTQFGKTSVLRPGDMVVYDSTQPYCLDLTEPFSQTVLQFSKASLLSRLPFAETLGGTWIDGQSDIGRLVRESILAFSVHLKSGTPAFTATLQETLLDLVATGLAGGRKSDLALSSFDRQILLRARSFIASHIRDPELDRNRVASATGLSVRRLNAIFQCEGSSIAGEIRQKRLDVVAAALRDPRFAALSISEVAMRCGYSNLQHFSTLFRKVFGRSPRGYRDEQA
ncbi:helix-turn-helix domain-containing protein [Stappia sp. BW2]|uniref:AraC-like ligand-binding domain-containing protein n=1 Tax=Stappia sp. BW2 TaxID=2592622 RepID=UPI0011DEFE66|nr:helix-turn-helix domain-containing protein [Stappia sp. BW2]TYC64649.1 helix-turn-helix domain-containing protein [Stappia sp. BW2]